MADTEEPDKSAVITASAVPNSRNDEQSQHVAQAEVTQPDVMDVDDEAGVSTQAGSSRRTADVNTDEPLHSMNISELKGQSESDEHPLRDTSEAVSAPFPAAVGAPGADVVRQGDGQVDSANDDASDLYEPHAAQDDSGLPSTEGSPPFSPAPADEPVRLESSDTDMQAAESASYLPQQISTGVDDSPSDADDIPVPREVGD